MTSEILRVRTRSWIAVAAALCTLTGTGGAASAGPVLTFDPATGGSGVNNGQNVGWQFDVLTTLTVTGLGWYDDGADGLLTAHQVGLWGPAGVLLASVTVPAGTTAPLDGQFRTVAISPLVLPAGDGYVVGGLTQLFDPERLASNVAQVVDPRVRYVDATFGAFGPTLQRPTLFSTATTGFYGPSFSVDGGPVAAVPAPAGAVLLASGLVFGLGRAACRRLRGRAA